MAEGECVLLRRRRGKPVSIDSQSCTACGLCLQLACPAIGVELRDGKRWPVIDPLLCNGCGLCAMVCSFKLWSVKEGKARLAPRYQELCLECGACWDICEAEAIDFSYPPGGTGVVIEFG